MIYRTPQEKRKHESLTKLAIVVLAITIRDSPDPIKFKDFSFSLIDNCKGDKELTIRSFALLGAVFPEWSSGVIEVMRELQKI